MYTVLFKTKNKMVKQKKNLWILGGGIAGVLIIALGAFALNPQGGLYKGAITTDGYDTELTSYDLKDAYLFRTEDESLPAPLPDPPEEEEELPDIIIGEELPQLLIGVPEEEAELGLPPQFETEFELATLPIEGVFINQPLEPQEWPSILPQVSGYNPAVIHYEAWFPNIETIYEVPSDVSLPSPYYDQFAEVLHFNVESLGVSWKQPEAIYLHDFYVDYTGCIGNADFKPQTTPTLWVRDTYDQYGIHHPGTGVGHLIATDSNKDGVFARNEFNNSSMPLSVTEAAPQTYLLTIKMAVDNTMCSANAKAKVIVRDILWSDTNGEYYLLDPDIPNDLTEMWGDWFSVVYDLAIL